MGRRQEKLEEAVAGLPADQVLCCAGDVSDRAAVTAIAREVAERFGPVDTLVTSAGINSKVRTTGEIEPSDWDEGVAVNLTGVFNAVRAVLPGMRAARSGVIVNIASIAGLRASKLAGAAYSAAKHGVVALTHSINEEERESGIRASAICPGEVATPILELRPEPVSPERLAAMLKPEDVSAAVLFVATLPAHVCVPELIIKPVYQVYQ